VLTRSGIPVEQRAADPVHDGTSWTIMLQLVIVMRSDSSGGTTTSGAGFDDEEDP